MKIGIYMFWNWFKCFHKLRYPFQHNAKFHEKGEWKWKWVIHLFVISDTSPTLIILLTDCVLENPASKSTTPERSRRMVRVFVYGRKIVNIIFDILSFSINCEWQYLFPSHLVVIIDLQSLIGLRVADNNLEAVWRMELNLINIRRRLSGEFIKI